MSKSLAQQALILDNGPNDLRIEFYISDAAATPPNDPRVIIKYLRSGQVVTSSDHPVSAYSTITNAQKLALRNTLLAIRDETFTLDGAV
jgi:hypothetical protein